MRIMGGGGIKFIMNNLHMIPWCFQFMAANDGNSSSSADSCRPSSSSSSSKNKRNKQQPQPQKAPSPPPAVVIKVIKSDGMVKIYDKPIKVSELMVQYPKHLVCNSDSFYIGQKIPALSEKDKLQLGQKYFLLPCQFFQSVLSFVTIASFAASAAAHQHHQLPQQLQRLVTDDAASSVVTSTSTSAKAAFVIRNKAAVHYCKPFDIQKTPSGCLKIRVSDEFISQLMEEQSSSSASKKMKNSHDDDSEVVVDKLRRRGLLCTTDELEKDYKQLVEGCRLIHWKPKLESITEIIENNNKKKKKKHHRKISSSFRVMKRSLSRSIRSRSSEHHHHNHHLVHFTTCAKPKLKPPSSSNCSNHSANIIFRSTKS